MRSSSACMIPLFRKIVQLPHEYPLSDFLTWAPVNHAGCVQAALCARCILLALEKQKTYYCTMSTSAIRTTNKQLTKLIASTQFQPQQAGQTSAIMRVHRGKQAIIYYTRFVHTKLKMHITCKRQLQPTNPCGSTFKCRGSSSMAS